MYWRALSVLSMFYLLHWLCFKVSRDWSLGVWGFEVSIRSGTPHSTVYVLLDKIHMRPHTYISSGHVGSVRYTLTAHLWRAEPVGHNEISLANHWKQCRRFWPKGLCQLQNTKCLLCWHTLHYFQLRLRDLLKKFPCCLSLMQPWAWKPEKKFPCCLSLTQHEPVPNCKVHPTCTTATDLTCKRLAPGVHTYLAIPVVSDIQFTVKQADLT